jgi:acylphosphatase
MFVKGRVQGVFFRAYTKEQADKAGVKGFVRNLAGGTVEIVSEGSDIELRHFLNMIEKGPPQSKVEDITVKWEEPKNEFKKFYILG